MGMDITAYAQVQLIDPGQSDNVAFALDAEAISRWPLATDGLCPGRYRSTGAEFEVRVGQLIGYMWWRERLAGFAGYSQHEVFAKSVTSGPFVEFISFADLHGVIGHAAVRKLSQDFENYDPNAKTLGSSFYDLYLQFRRAFKFAKDGGVVSIF